MKFVQRIFFLVIIFLFVSVLGKAWAENVSFSANVDRNTVELGSFVQLTLNLVGAKASGPVTLPAIDGVQSRYLGPSTHVSIVNGNYSSSVSYIYNLYPTKVGTVQIPSLQIDVNGKQYASEPITLNVVSSGSGNTSSSGGASSSAQKLQDKLFMLMGTPKKEYYLNEKIPLTIKLFINGLSVKNVQYPEFAHDGFLTDEFQEPAQYQQTIKGIKYDIVEFKEFIYPARVGSFSLGPAKDECTVLFKSKRRSRGGFGIFDDDFFNGFFGDFDARSISLESMPLELNILPLPEEGRPKDFSGSVGQYNFDVSVSPKDVKLGDPITLRMTVSGEGNLKAVNFPEINDKEKFKLYDPQTHQEQNSMVLEQVVIPKSDNIKDVPRLTFTFFDPEKREYRSIEKGPFQINVAPLEKGEELKVVGLTPDKFPVLGQTEKLGQDIVYIKKFPGTLMPVGFLIYKSWLFYVLLVLMVLGWLVLYIIYIIRYRIRTDERFARRLQAPRYARKGLSEAKKLLMECDQKSFYDSLFRTLQKYFSNKWHIQAGAMDIQTVLNVIRNQGIKETIAKEIETAFEECEMVRYASTIVDSGKMKDSYIRVEKIIDYFERGRK